MRKINTLAVLAAIVIPLVCGLIASYIISHISLFTARHGDVADRKPHDDYDL